MKEDLNEFFSLIGKAKKEKEEEFRSLVGDINIDSIFSSVKLSLEEEKKKKAKKLKEEKKKKEKEARQVKALEAWLYAEPKEEKESESNKITIDDLNGKPNFEVIDVIKPQPIGASVVKEEFIQEIIGNKTETEREIEIEHDTIDHALKILETITTKEEVRENTTDPEILKIRRELEYLKNLVNAQGGGGEVRLEFLDDVDRTTAKTNGYVLQYDSSAAKFIGTSYVSGGGGSSTIGISSNGVSIGTGVTTLNFVGTGNTFIIDGTTATISISGNTFNVNRDTQTYVATAGQTTFNVVYDSLENVDVYINGIRLSSNQYTATSGTDIILSEGAAENDIVDVVGISAGTAAGGSDLTIKDNDTLIGVTSSINFGTNLSVTSISSGIATINVSGLTTSDISGYGVGYASTDYVSSAIVGLASVTYVDTAVAGVANTTLDGVLNNGNTSSLGMSVGVVTATSFDGNATSATTATTAGSATTSTKVTVGLTPNSLSNWYVGLSSGVLGDHQIHGDIGLTFVPSTNALTASKFSGELNGNVFTNTGVSTFTAINASGAINFTTQTPDINISSQIIGSLTLGGASQTGTQTFGRSTKTHTANFASGASESGETKTINFGVGGLSGSVTEINIGPSIGIGTFIVNSGTNVGLGSTLPSAKLDVVGDVKVTGVITATSFDGNATSSTYATTAGISTLAQGLTGTPSIIVNSITAADASFSGNVSIAGTLTYEDVTSVDSLGIVTARSGVYVGPITSIGATITPSGDASFVGVVTAASFSGITTSMVVGLSAVASSGSYNDLTNKPTIPTDTGDLTNNAGFVTSGIVVGYATEGYVNNLVAISTFSGDYNDLTNKPTIPTDTGDLTNSVGFITSGGSGANLTGIVTAITAGANISILENPSGNFIITATVQGGTQNLDSVLTQGNVSGIGISVGISTFSGNVYVGSGVTITSNDIGIVGVITANTGSFNNFTIADTLTVGSQVFYAQGTNGFSVNEDFDPSNVNYQTAYHYTSGIGRSEVAFTLARTNAFTNGFGIYGTSANNTFVSFGEANNTNWEWRRGVGIRPLDLDGGTLLMKLSSTGNLSISGIVTTSAVSLTDANVSSVTATTTTTSEVSIDSFSATLYRSAKYQIQITRGSEYQITEIYIVHDGTSSYGTEYATVKTGSSLSTFSTDISGGNVRLLATPTDTASTVFKIVRTLVEV